MEVVDDVEREAAAVVALTLVDADAIGVHSPAVVGCVEDVSRR